MSGEKSTRIKSLNQSETEVLHHLFENPNFKVRDLSLLVHRSEGGIRTNLTAIFDKLGVPDGVANKREYVVSEYSEVYQKVFKRGESQPEMFIDPPDPVLVNDSQPKPNTIVGKAEKWRNERAEKRQREIEIIKEHDPNNPEYQALHNRIKRRLTYFVILVLITIFFLGAWVASTFN